MTMLQRLAASRGSAALWLIAVCVVMVAITGAADEAPDPAGQGRHLPHGTRFPFEVIESFNAKYEGDTPGHVGRGGGFTLHPHVALGDAVYHEPGDEGRAIGVVTGLKWDRLRGSLAVEFRPTEDDRIAVGDEVWIDLNPTAVAGDARDAFTPLEASRSEPNSRGGDTAPGVHSRNTRQPLETVR